MANQRWLVYAGEDWEHAMHFFDCDSEKEAHELGKLLLKEHGELKHYWVMRFW